MCRTTALVQSERFDSGKTIWNNSDRLQFQWKHGYNNTYLYGIIILGIAYWNYCFYVEFHIILICQLSIVII